MTEKMNTDSLNADVSLQCPTCRARLNVSRSVDRVEEKCPVCSSQISMAVFPRFFREEPEMINDRIASEDEAICSFHGELKAEKVCDECGCLMSLRASVNWGDRDYCLPCLYQLREEKKSASFVAQAKLHDNLALALVTWLAPFSFFTAPVALFLLLRYRKGSQTFAPRSPLRWWLALLLSSAWILLWGAVIIIWISLILDEVS